MRHKLIQYSLLTISLLGAGAAVYAVPAKPGLFSYPQADGTTLNVELRGDERSHFYLSEDGYLLTNVNDKFYYGNVVDGHIKSSGIRANAPLARSAQEISYLRGIDRETQLADLHQAADARIASRRRSVAPNRSAAEANPSKGLFPGTHFPAIGDQKAIVILVEYADVKMTLPDPYTYFNNMLNEEGFSQYNGTGSARDFFIESSGGAFIPQFDVFGPVTLAHNRSYYGGNDWYGNDLRPEEMIIEACELLDDEVNFSEYDRDGDGYIDNVFVFYAGRGEASGGSSDTVWPHSWDITSATSTPYIFDGVRLDRYGCTNEYETGRPDGVGTFVHEFSHVMGLPDLYATSYTSAFTPGEWSALDYGPYNNNGCTPPLYGAFERYALGWMEPDVVDYPLSVELPSISSNSAVLIPTHKENEFFLLENRQKESWDSYLPGHGMLIWHVDYNENVWATNTVNNSSSHQYVDIEEADAIRTESSRAGDAFPGTANVTSFTSSTTPSMLTWDKTDLDLPITDISETSDRMILFNVKGGGLMPINRRAVTALEADVITEDGFTARWEALEGAEDYLLSVYTRKYGEPYIDICDFTDGVKNLPAGWTSTSASSYANTAYSGEAVPSLRLSTNADYLESPLYDDQIKYISFWHRGNSTPEDDRISVNVFANGKWVLLKDVAVVSASGGESISFTDDIPEGACRVRIGYSRSGDKGALALDDIVIGHGETFTNVPLPDYTEISTGNTTKYTLTDLNPDSDYYYIVTATDSEGLRSIPSEEIAVRTNAGSSITETAVSDVSFRIVDTTLHITGKPETLKIWTSDGRLEYSGSFTGNLEISLDRGLYILRIGDTSYKILI